MFKISFENTIKEGTQKYGNIYKYISMYKDKHKKATLELKCIKEEY